MKSYEKSITYDEMQIAELNSEFLGTTHFQLMEAVGSGIAHEINSRETRRGISPKIHVMAGTGKNGGDGFAVARHLASMGFVVKVTLVGRVSEVRDDSAKHQLDAILQMSSTIEFDTLHDSSQIKPVKSDIILDALLGTGVKGDIRQPILAGIRAINKSEGYKIALDLPSGLDTDTGEPHGDAVKADSTICLHRIKAGVIRAKQYTGETLALPIGIPPEAEIYAGPGDFRILWKPRPPESRKADFGRLIIVGGSENFTGAPAFAALAATKCGTDLVYVASPQKTSEIIASYSPDLINIKLPGDHLNTEALAELSPWLQRADAVILGPGIGLNRETVEFVWHLIDEVEELGKPIVLDADAVKIFGQKRRSFKNPAVITPHLGEYEIVAQRKLDPEIAHRQNAVVQLANELGATVILKGHVDIIAGQDRTKLNRTGNAYMTVGGTGDVLTGIVGALLAQHAEPFRAASAATFLNGLTGDLFLKEKGPTITTEALLEFIPRAIKYCIDGPPYPPLNS